MAGIAEVFDEVEKLLRVGYPKLTTGVGANLLNRQESPPRVIWIIPSVAHSPPQKVGRPRSLQTRDVSVVAHVWAENLRALEELIEDTIAALHRVTYGSLQFGGEQWLPVEDGDRGMATLLRFTLSGPSRERRFKYRDRARDMHVTKATVTTIDADTTGSAQGDGAIDWKEP